MKGMDGWTNQGREVLRVPRLSEEAAGIAAGERRVWASRACHAMAVSAAVLQSR